MRFVQRDFSAGELSPHTYGRPDAPYYYRGARIMENYIPLPTGSVVRRPGMLSLFATRGARPYVVRTNSDNSYLLVLKKDSLSCYYIHDKKFPDIPLSPEKHDTINDMLDIKDVQWKNTSLDDINITTVGLNVYITHYSFPPVVVSFEGLSIRVGAIPVFINQFNENKSDGYKIGEMVNYNRITYAATRDIDGAAGGSKIVAPFSGIEAWEDVGEAFTRLPSNWQAGRRGTVVYGGYYWTYWEDTLDHPFWQSIFGFINRLHEIKNAQKYERGIGSPPHEKETSRWRRGGKAQVANAALWAANVQYAAGDKSRYNGRLYQARVAHKSITGQEPDKDVAWKTVGISPLFEESGRHPHIIFGYEDRLMCFGCSDSPSIIWASRTGGHANFSGGLRDSDSFIIQIDGEGDNYIEWVMDVSGLTIGTSSGEWRLTGAQGGPLTPTSAQALRQSSIGSYGGAVIFNDILLFLDRTRRKIRQFVFSNDTRSYDVPDITLLSNHLFDSGIRSWAVQNNPYTILWMVMNDGTLVSGTYIGKQISFARHFSQDKHGNRHKYTGVSINHSAFGDQVFFSSETTMQMLAPIEQAEGSSFAYLDQSEFLPISTAHNFVEFSLGIGLPSGVIDIACGGNYVLAIVNKNFILKKQSAGTWHAYNMNYNRVLSEFTAITWFEGRACFIVTGLNTGVIAIDPSDMSMTRISPESSGFNRMNKFYEADGFLVCFGTSSTTPVAVPEEPSDPVITMTHKVSDIIYLPVDRTWFMVKERSIETFSSLTDTTPIRRTNRTRTWNYRSLLVNDQEVYYFDSSNAAEQVFYIYHPLFSLSALLRYSTITDIPSRIFFVRKVLNKFALFTATHVYIRDNLTNANDISMAIDIRPSVLSLDRIHINYDRGIIFAASNDTVFRIDVTSGVVSKSKIPSGIISVLAVKTEEGEEEVIVGTTNRKVFSSDGSFTFYVEPRIHNRAGGDNTAMIDNNLVNDFSTEQDGRYIVPDDAKKVYVGDPYTSTLQPQRYTPEDGSFDTDIRVPKIGVTVHKTKGVRIGVDPDELDAAIEDNIPVTGGAIPMAYTGELVQVVDHRYNGPWPRIVQDQPFPGEIQAAAYEIQGGRS